MSFSNKDYQVALSIVSGNREKAVRQADIRRNQLLNEHPEFEDLEREIAKTVLDVTRTMLSGASTKETIEQLQNKNQKLQKQKNDILTKIGQKADYLAPIYTCKKCDDTGYVDGKMCICVKNIAKAIVYERLNNTTPLENSRFDNFDTSLYPDGQNEVGINPRKRMERIYKYCKDYAKTFNAHSESYLFLGATGLGKTHLSLAITNAVIEKGYNVIYGPISHLLRNIEDEYFNKNNTQAETQKSIIECDLLILDDLGTEFTSSFVVSVFYDIINSRILANKPTIISTNLSVEELEKKYNARILSRLVGNYKTFEFFGNDLREQK